MGKFLLVDYTGKIAATGELFDTTVEEEAKEADSYHEEHAYKPALVILGKRMIVKGVEEVLERLEPGKEETISVQPEKAFGARDPQAIKTIPIAKFHEKQIEPAPGMFVDVGGIAAKVQSVSGGRVRVDFNNPLAGRELIYKIRLVKVLEDVKEKADAVLDYLGLEGKAELREGRLVVETAQAVDSRAKEFLGGKIRDLLEEVKEVEFVPVTAKKAEAEAVPK